MDPVRETVFEWFKECIVEVWGKWPEHLDLKLGDDEPGAIGNERPLASLAYLRTAKPWAVGRHLVSYPREATLRISERLLVEPPERIRKILLHEAVHLGYSGHGTEFRAVAREVGATISESALDDDTIKVQRKVGARYHTVKTFPGADERAAAAWMHEQAAAGRSGGQVERWRMLMGYDDLDGRRKPPKDERPLWERIEDAVDGHSGDIRDFLTYAYEADPNLDVNDDLAVKCALLSYAENERALEREREQERERG